MQRTDVVDNNIVIAVFAANCRARFSSVSGGDVVVFSISGIGVVVARRLVVVVVVCPVARRPLHFVFLLESASGVGEPRRHLCEGHLGDDCEHDLLALRRVRVLDVLVQPRLERARRLARRVFASHVQTAVTAYHITIITHGGTKKARPL